jgi:hypothetical protein
MGCIDARNLLLVTFFFCMSKKSFTLGELGHEQEATCSAAQASKVVFQIGSQVHRVAVTRNDASFEVDDVPRAPVAELNERVADGQTSDWLPLARSVLSDLGVFTESAAPALAGKLQNVDSNRRESLRDACRSHFRSHGGMGVLGGEDVSGLLGDHCCDEVQQDLLEFYVG